MNGVSLERHFCCLQSVRPDVTRPCMRGLQFFQSNLCSVGMAYTTGNGSRSPDINAQKSSRHLYPNDCFNATQGVANIPALPPQLAKLNHDAKASDLGDSTARFRSTLFPYSAYHTRLRVSHRAKFLLQPKNSIRLNKKRKRTF